MPYRDIELFSKPVENVEALRIGKVLKVDAAEAGGHPLDGLNDLIRILGIENDGEGANAAEILEQQRLALHHRQTGHGADVAQPQHARAVRNNGDGVGFVGVLEGLGGIGMNLATGRGHTGRVPNTEIIEAVDGALQRRFHFAAIKRVHPRGLLPRDLGARNPFFYR